MWLLFERRLGFLFVQTPAPPVVCSKKQRVCVARLAGAGALLLEPPSARLPEMPVWRWLSQARGCEATLLRDPGHTKSTYVSRKALGVRTLLAVRSRLPYPTRRGTCPEHTPE